jgi:hypothetical protein
MNIKLIIDRKGRINIAMLGLKRGLKINSLMKFLNYLDSDRKIEYDKCRVVKGPET